MLGWEENSNVILQTKDMKLKTLGHEQIEFCVCIKGLCRKEKKIFTIYRVTHDKPSYKFIPTSCRLQRCRWYSTTREFILIKISF